MIVWLIQTGCFIIRQRDGQRCGAEVDEAWMQMVLSQWVLMGTTATRRQSNDVFGGSEARLWQQSRGQICRSKTRGCLEGSIRLYWSSEIAAGIHMMYVFVYHFGVYRSSSQADCRKTGGGDTALVRACVRVCVYVCAHMHVYM